jgi:hypothetical protein
MSNPNVLYTAGVTLYGKAVKASTPWATDVVAITENPSYPGLYPTLTANPFIYLQAAGSPADSDTFLFDSREQHYGDVTDGDLFHQRRIHSWDWENATIEDKCKALYAATGMIDKFSFIGVLVEDTQGLEFPRTRTLTDGTVCEIGGTDGVPDNIAAAAFLIADALLGGRDPQEDFESLRVKSETVSGIRTEFESARTPSDHVSNLVPSASAWALILPFLNIDTAFTMNKA